MNVVQTLLQINMVLLLHFFMKMMLPGAVFELETHRNAYTSPRTPLEKLTELPHPTWFSYS